MAHAALADPTDSGEMTFCGGLTVSRCDETAFCYLTGGDLTFIIAPLRGSV